MKIIPRKTKVRTEFVRGITLMDIIVGVIGIVVALALFFSNFAGNLGLWFGIAWITVIVAMYFKVADDMLKQGIVGIVDLIATPSHINLDFADVNTVMRNQGLAHMGIGRAKGENRVIEAVRQAVSSPLLETTIEGAKSIILNVTGGRDLMLTEVNEAATLVQGIIDPSANIILGQTIDENMSEEVKITVIATGFTPINEEVKVDVKPSFQFVEENSTPPLLREIENATEKEEMIKEVETQEVVSEQPVQQEQPVPEKKTRELPAFMRKLFRK